MTTILRYYIENESLCLQFPNLKIEFLTQNEEETLKEFVFNATHKNFLGKWSRFDLAGNEYQFIEKLETGLQVGSHSDVFLYQDFDKDIRNLHNFFFFKLTKYIDEPLPKDMYDKISRLGSSILGKTRRMEDLYNNQLYAVKIVELNDKKVENELKNEVNKLKELSHANIGKYYDCFFNINEICIVMELVIGYPLYDKIQDKTVQFEDKINWFKQISSTLCFIHDKGFKHGNIRPTNIFIVSNGIKLINFAFDILEVIKCNHISSTIYMSYEKYNACPYDERDDIWALGCVMTELILGKHITDLNSKRLQLLEECKSVNYEYGTIISKMLEVKQETRCTSRDLMNMLN